MAYVLALTSRLFLTAYFSRSSTTLGMFLYLTLISSTLLEASVRISRNLGVIEDMAEIAARYLIDSLSLVSESSISYSE